MAGKKRTFSLESVSDDGTSFSAKDEEERRTMGCATEAAHFRAGKKVHLQERGKGTFTLYMAPGDEGFLMVDADQEMSGLAALQNGQGDSVMTPTRTGRSR